MLKFKFEMAILALCIFGGTSKGVTVPDGGLRFSNRYETRGVLTVPQAEVRESFHAWFEGDANKSRIDFYEGSVKTFQFAQLGEYGTSIQIVPVKNREDGSDFTCWRFNGTEYHKILAQSVIPDVSEFTIVGDDSIDGVYAEKWERRVTQNSVKSQYTLWVRYRNAPGNSEERIAIPVRYEVMGTDDLISSHYDHFFLDYDWFSNKEVDQSTFEVPKEFEGKCKDSNDSDDDFALFSPMKEYINGEKQHISAAFEKFKRRYNRHYSSASEEAFRRMIFTENYRYIMSTNRANRLFTVGINVMADRSVDEMRHKGVPMNFTAELPEDQPEIIYSVRRQLPLKFDWVTRGAVTRIKDQARCAACWSFAATGAVEGAHFVRCGRTTRMSEQALVDCTAEYGNRGCIGGTARRAFEWMMSSDGLPTTDAYGRYKGQVRMCHANEVDRENRIRVSNYRKVHADIENIKFTLMTKGPMAVSFDSTRKSFSLYTGGVYDYCGCDESKRVCSQKLVHAGVLVGYGVHEKQGPYWVVKNSWGEDWGDNGYILIPQKISEDCGLSIAPYYVQIENCVEE